MGKRSRDKGQRIENEVVHLHLDTGIPASRVPLSGAHGGEYAGDVRILDFTGEVKARANGEGFKQLEKWLGDHDLLFLRRDRQRPLVGFVRDTCLCLMRHKHVSRTNPLVCMTWQMYLDLMLHFTQKG